MSFDTCGALRSEAQIYTFAGYIAGEYDRSEAAIRTGLALALSHEQVIHQMSTWGFNVTAVSALHEVRDTLAALEAIAAGAPDVDPADYVNLLGSPPPYVAEHVFAFSGQHPGSAAVFAGFAVASSSQPLVDELARVQFEVCTSTTLAELRALEDEMASAHEGDDNVIDLAGLALVA